jgi:hypothetical protein
MAKDFFTVTTHFKLVILSAMSRPNQRTINHFGFFVQSENTFGCTGGRDDLDAASGISCPTR